MATKPHPSRYSAAARLGTGGGWPPAARFTIHLYHSYLRRRRAGHGWMFSLARSFEASGRAVVAISILLVAQFALLTTSEFQPTADFGLLASVGLLTGQIFELLLLLALIVVWKRWLARRATVSSA